MSVLEYALDVNKTVSEIIELCEKLDIKVQNADELLSQDDIILLDNELQDMEDYVVEDIEESQIDSDEFFEKVESLAANTKFVSEKQKKKGKVKQNKTENNESFLKGKKEIYKHREKLQTNDVQVDENVILYKENMTVSELAESLEVTPSELIKKLMGLGIMTTVNNSVAFDIAEILVLEYNKVLKKEETADISNFEKYEIIDDEKDLLERPPVVTIMGHVDHGKTSLLDAIRKTNVVSGEAGGITQAIGAYQVECNEKKITFIDTPGHEAFTEMRARGASVTDIVIIIVAADDGVMPQTKEAIDHAKAANAPIIVAINKIDKPDANPDRVLTELVEYGITPEEWGGDTICVRISAKTGDGIAELLENILLLSEMAELKANPSRYATGTVIESRLDKQVGSVATVLIQNGTLRLGDPIVVGTSVGKIRTLKNDKGQDIIEALPSTPVEITGLNMPPQAGDKFMAFETEKQAKSIAEERTARAKETENNKPGMTLEDLFGHIKEGTREINVILKADVNGSSEAVKKSLEKIEVEDVRVKVIRSGVGTITESDIVLAKASNAIIIGFNVRPTSTTTEVAKENGVEIRLYDIIYKVVEDMEKAMKGMLEPVYDEKITGEAEIRQIFKFSKVGNIAGSHVTNGTVKMNSNARLIRDGIVLYTGKIKSIQREKDQAKEVTKGMDCGITLENYQDIKEGDIIESFELIEIER
ncbi:MAG: translation initiation factor IF-2 [Firmicutes bacterium]|nr:translation initiation factor IF-2 [Bacillota bacterium]